ncbi:hypothetical protein PUN28_012315 [Cardiocondyla obscurior]|uniref:Uncharacterized protein n=1 Tax=Cardiocondyla obscurior TaxID=286306 RepID=A0AAW2FE00_9HYME
MQPAVDQQMTRGNMTASFLLRRNFLSIFSRDARRRQQVYARRKVLKRRVPRRGLRLASSSSADCICHCAHNEARVS